MQASFYYRYLFDILHPKASKLKKKEPKYVKMKCQTNLNENDCAIFVMRHMETFMGGQPSKYNCNLTYESHAQQKELWELRKKYLAKILLCDLNVNKDVVIQEANEFSKLPKERREHIKYEAWLRREDRMKEM